MKPRYSGRFFRKVLVPVIYGSEHTAALHAALAITGPKNVWAVGILGISEAESLSTAAVPARHVRKTLRELVNRYVVANGRGVYIATAFHSREECF